MTCSNLHVFYVTYSFIFFCEGVVVATFCYLQFFPPPYHANGMLFRNILNFADLSRNTRPNILIEIMVLISMEMNLSDAAVGPKG